MKRITRILSVFILVSLFITPTLSNALTQRQEDWFTLMDEEYVDKKGIDDVELSGSGQFQCTQVMWHYGKFLFGKESYELFNGPTNQLLDYANRDYFDVFKLSENPDAQIQRGDIPVWDFGSFGHVGVAKSPFPGGFKAYEQNVHSPWGGRNQVVKIVNNYSYSDVVGWLRPKEEKILPSETKPDEVLGMIEIDSKDYEYINIRKQNSTDSEIIGEAYTGERYLYYRLVNGWYKIKKGDEFGWIRGDFAEEIEMTFEHVDRISGKDRYKTALKIADAVNENPEKYIIASGANFPDALCASNIAGADYPILLTDNNSISDEVISKLEDKEVVILGGKGAVSEDIEVQILSVANTVTRIGGKNRYETSLNIVEQNGIKDGLIIASGENFPDAMSSTSLANKYNIPIVLTPKDTLSEDLEALISEITGNIYIIGGKGVITEEVMNQIKTIHPDTYRISGKNRYKTNAAILDEFGVSQKTYVVTGENFPDSLTASVLAAKNNAPLVLSPKYDITESYSAYIEANRPHTATIVGGKGVISIELQIMINELCE